MKRIEKVKYKDSWVLTHDLVEVHFVNDVATEIKFCGTLFKYIPPKKKTAL